MKAVKAKLTEAGKSAEEIKDFETKAGAFAKKVLGSFKDYEFYTGESMDPDAMCVFSFPFGPVDMADFFSRVVLLNYREDGTTPYVTVWKHGLKAEKV